MSLVYSWKHRTAVAVALGLASSVLTQPAAAHASADPAPGAALGVVQGADSPDAVPGRYIVTLKHGARASGGSVQGSLAGRLTHLGASTYAARLSDVQARQLAADPAVAAVEQDQVVRIDATQRNPVWNLDRIDQRSRVGSRSFTPMSDGSSVHAYVIDTGVKITHNEFGGRATYGWDFYDDDANAGDCNGHGTHVAGTIGGTRYGVAKRVKIVSVRVLNCQGIGFVSDVIDSLNWVTANAVKPAVANMSLSAGYSPALELAVQESIDSGITYAVAAGNANQNAANYSPSGLPSAITVAATDSGDRRASFSNWGSTVDIFAPGVKVRSAYRGSTTATALLSGTSMAAPHVAGAAAMVLDAAPTYTPQQVRDYLVARSTKGKVINQRYSPDRLLYTP
ncbi:MAG TPA: S8 family peptidase, partial [Actinoplanes sp.]|nr:S8 family peptidase [Actinoplanes sp.]